jgi:hypothetical protein
MLKTDGGRVEGHYGAGSVSHTQYSRVHRVVHMPLPSTMRTSANHRFPFWLLISPMSPKGYIAVSTVREPLRVGKGFPAYIIPSFVVCVAIKIQQACHVDYIARV